MSGSSVLAVSPQGSPVSDLFSSFRANLKKEFAYKALFALACLVAAATAIFFVNTKILIFFSAALIISTVALYQYCKFYLPWLGHLSYDEPKASS